MKILYLSNSILPSKYANSVQVMRMCDALADYRFNIELFAKSYENKTVEELYSYYGVKNEFDIIVIKIPQFRGGGFLSLFSLFKFLKNKNKNEDIVFARDIYGAYMAHLMGFVVIFEYHGLPTNFLIKFMDRKLLNNTKHKFIYISKALQEYHQKFHGFKNTQSIVLHDGANPIKLLSEEIKKDVQIEVGYIGSLYKGRGVDIIIECAKTLPEIRFSIVGGNINEIEHYKQLASGNINFYGFVEPNQVQNYLQKFDILLMPYQKGLEIAGRKVDTSAWMSPMKMFEYMSANKCIISSDLPVIREVLNDTNSILVKADSIEEWTMAIKNASSNSELRDKLANQANQDFIKHYTWKARAIEIKNIITRMSRD